MIISPDTELEIMNDGQKIPWSFERHYIATKNAQAKFFNELTKTRDEELYVFVMSGLPSSGKTTIAEKLLKLSEDKSVIIYDATNVNKWKRLPILAASKYCSNNTKTAVVHVRTPLSICMERMAEKPEDKRMDYKSMDSLNFQLDKPGSDEPVDMYIVADGISGELKWHQA